MKRHLCALLAFAIAIAALTFPTEAQAKDDLKNTDPENLSVMRAIKAALDDRHILNDHISYLK